MPSLGRELSTPKAWFLTVRLLEACGLALLVGAAQEAWVTIRMSDQFAQGPTDGTGATPTLMDRIVAFALYGPIRGPVSVILCAMVIAACLVVLHRGQPVSNAHLLRWELMVLWAICTVFTVGYLLTWGLAMFGDDPNRPDGVVSGYPGPSLVEQSIGGLAWPAAAALMLAACGVWWLRLPADPDGGEDVTPSEPRRWRPAPAPRADADDIVLDGVEQIDAVDRLEPRAPAFGDESSTSGYDEYFRRF